jgi:2',3'-cyclic-nucleotide 2'-phosphodiesterase/3'-nucleotidase
MHRFLMPFLAAALLHTAPARVTLLATTDLHGHLLPYDYYTARPANRGIAKLATLVAHVRRENPNTILIDNGDTIQGSPLESVHQAAVRAGKHGGRPDPMMAAMNRLGYAAMTLGNHEFNFGLDNLLAARRQAQFPWLSANTRVRPGSSQPAFDAAIVKQVGPAKVAVIGLTTPAIPNWEKPENYAGYEFLPPLEAARETVARIRAEQSPDIVVLAVHAGAADGPDPIRENTVLDIAKGVPGIDAIVYGHTHQQVEERTVNGVLLMQPGSWGVVLGRIDFDIEKSPSGWRVVSKRGRLLRASTEVAADPAILAIAAPYHEAAEKYLNTPVATAPADLDGSQARIRDTALVDSIQQVQLHITGADVSFASLFRPSVHLRKGPITVREIAAIYVYDNELYIIEGNGRMVKDALENAARYFLACTRDDCSNNPAVDSGFPAFNYDMAQGVEYEIDLRRAEGQRIVGLRFRGKPLEAGRKLKIAINSYRAAGSGGYSMFRDAKILWRSGVEIRDLMVDYYTRVKLLPAAADNNWCIKP